MQQVLVRIPTDTSWFVPIFVLVGLALGAVVWAMFTRDRRSLPVFVVVTGILAYWLGGILADKNPDGIPLYGYGMMLFLAFIVCTALAARLAQREGIAIEHIQDLAIYLFVGGVIGSRLWYYVEDSVSGRQVDFSKFFHIWEGGLVWYGGMMGGAIAYVIAYYTIIKKNKISTLKLADIIAPCAALGLCLGRIGCLLNGCCYGEVACANCAVVPVHFPLSGMPLAASDKPLDIVSAGYQSFAGFTLITELEAPTQAAIVAAVEPGSPAAEAGLRQGDEIVKADNFEVTTVKEDGRNVPSALSLQRYLRFERLRGQNELQLTVKRGGVLMELPAFRPKSLGLYPTQAYESISTILIMFLLLAYYPFRRHDGELLALFLMLYPIHRFLDEMLRADNEKVAFGLTLSQTGSILLFAIGLIFFLWLRRLPAQFQPAKQPAPTTS